jgi:hypothetical protein
MITAKHTCYRCCLEPIDDPSTVLGKVESLEGTRADDGGEVFFTSGYSAREIAQKRARETNALVYVNNVSRKIKRPDLSVPVAYAVATSPVYTLKRSDDLHAGVYRAYWPPLT